MKQFHLVFVALFAVSASASGLQSESAPGSLPELLAETFVHCDARLTVETWNFETGKKVKTDLVPACPLHDEARVVVNDGGFQARPVVCEVPYGSLNLVTGFSVDSMSMNIDDPILRVGMMDLRGANYLNSAASSGLDISMPYRNEWVTSHDDPLVKEIRFETSPAWSPVSVSTENGMNIQVSKITTHCTGLQSL